MDTSSLIELIKQNPKSVDDKTLSLLVAYSNYHDLNALELFKLGSLYLRLSEFDLCIKCCDVLEAKEGKLKYREEMLYAKALFRTGKFERALVNLLRLNGQRDLVRTRYLISKCYFELNQYQDSEQIIFDPYYDGDDKPRWYFIQEVHILDKLGKYNQALICIDKALSAYAGDEAFLTRKYHLQILIGQTEESVQTLNKLLSINPENIRIRFLKAQLHLEKLQFELAEEEFNAILEHEPFIKAFVGLAELELIKGRVEASFELTEKALNLANDPFDVLSCLNILLKLEKEDRVDDIIEGFDTNLFDAQHFSLLSTIRNNQKKYDDAILCLEKALTLDNQNLNYYIDLARIYFDKGDYRMAEFELIINDLMDSNLAFRARYLFCRIARKEQRRHISLQRFRDFCLLYPENFQIKKELIFELTQLSRFNEIQDLLNKELLRDSRNIEAFKLLIKNYLIQQNYTKVLDLIIKFEIDYPSSIDNDLMSSKLKCLREMGKFEHCQELIDNLLKQDPDSYPVNMESASLERSKGHLYFFEKDIYNEKSKTIHCRMLNIYPLKTRQIRIELVQDLILLNKFKEALELTDQSIIDYPDELNYYLQKNKILQKIGSQEESLEFIVDALKVFVGDPQLWYLKCETLFNLNKLDRAEEELLKFYEFNPSLPDTLKLLIKLYIKINNFKVADVYLNKGIKLAPSIVLNDSIIVDYFLLDHESRFKLENILKIKEEPEDSRLLQLTVSKNLNRDALDLEEVFIISQIVLTTHNFIPDLIIEYSLNGNLWRKISPSVVIEEDHKLVYRLKDLPIRYLRLTEETKVSAFKLYSYYPISTNSKVQCDIEKYWEGMPYSFRIAETGLGDQLHYLRTSALIAETLGMQFKGYLEEDLKIIRDRVTENPYLYTDLGFRNTIVDPENYTLIEIGFKSHHNLSSGMLKWPSFKLFIKEMKAIISSALKAKEEDLGMPISNPLFVFEVADHTFTRTIARQFFPFSEPNTNYRETLRKNYLIAKNERGENLLNEGQVKLVLQCRLGDVANVPVTGNGKDYIIIPFSGEVFDRSNFEVNHQRNSNLEIINKIGKSLKDKFGEKVDVCLMTDGYDYGINYLLNYKENLIAELGLNKEYLIELKTELELDLKKSFGFVDTILYGESYDNLITSIDNIDSADVILSTNGQFSNEFKMSLISKDDSCLIVKKLYANLRVKLTEHSKDLFWDTEVKGKVILTEVSKYIDLKWQE